MAEALLNVTVTRLTISYSYFQNYYKLFWLVRKNPAMTGVFLFDPSQANILLQNSAHWQVLSNWAFFQPCICLILLFCAAKSEYVESRFTKELFRFLPVSLHFIYAAFFGTTPLLA